MVPLGRALANGGKTAERAVLERVMDALTPLRKDAEGALPPAQVRRAGRGGGLRVWSHSVAARACGEGAQAQSGVPGQLPAPSSSFVPAGEACPLPLLLPPRLQAAKDLVGARVHLCRTSSHGGSYSMSDPAAEFCISRQYNSSMRYGEVCFR